MKVIKYGCQSDHRFDVAIIELLAPENDHKELNLYIVIASLRRPRKKGNMKVCK